MSKWSDFHQRHGERKFTPVFNDYLEALIADETAAVPERVDAWIERYSWGNHSDTVVDGENVILRQADCARGLNLDRRQVNPVFKDREKRGYIRLAREGAIMPIDDPAEPDSPASFAFRSPEVETYRAMGEEEAKTPEESISFGEYLAEVWAKQHPDEFREYQSLQKKVDRLRTAALSGWREHKRLSDRGRTNEGQRPTGAGHSVREVQDTVSDRPKTKSGAIKEVNLKHLNTVCVSAAAEFLEATGPQMPPPHEHERFNKARKALSRYETPDAATVQALVAACLQKDAQVTGEQIERVIHEKGKRWKGPGLAFFLQYVPPCFPIQEETHSPEQRLPDHLLPTSVKRLREQVQQAEAWANAAPEDRKLAEELQQMRTLLAREEEAFGIRKPTVKETAARAGGA